MDDFIQKQQLLTIGITTCYKSNVYKFKQLLRSLFSNFLLELPEHIQINSVESRDYLKTIIENFKIESLNKYDYFYELPKNIIRWLRKNNYKNSIELLIIIDDDPELENTNTDELIIEINKINQIIKKYIEVKYIVTPTNIKISCARNIIINEAKGKYLIFCDDDDLKMNINQMLNIIIENDSDNYNYISHYVHKDSYENINHTIVPHISNIGIWNGIYLTSFLKENNIYFVPNLNMEDVVWRSNLNYYLSYKNSKCKQISKIGYVYMDASNRSLNQINNRFLDNIDSNVISLLTPTNEKYYEELNKILSQQLQFDFKLTDWRLFGITSSISFYKQHNIIYQWLINNQKHIPDGYDKRMLELVSILDKEPNFSDPELKNISLFSILTGEDKRKAFWVFSKYITLPDLYSFAKYIDHNIILDVMNDIWRNNFSYNIYYKKITKNEYFEQFVYKFMHFIYMQKPNELYKKYINISLVEKIKQEYLKEIEYIPLNECLNFIHDRLCKSRKIVNKIENLFCNQLVKFSELYQTISSLIETNEEFKNDKDEILEITQEFIKQNQIETFEIPKYDKFYRGPMNVFQFYMFSLPLMNKLNRQPKIIKYNNFNNCKYEIQFCDEYYIKLNDPVDINLDVRNLDKYYNENELKILKNIHGYTSKKIKHLFKNKIRPKYLLKFNYDDLIYLYNNEIYLKIFDKIENYHELKLMFKLINKIIFINPEMVEIINSFSQIRVTDLTKILALLKLGFNFKLIDEYLSKEITDGNYDDFNKLNSKFIFYFKIESHIILKLYNKDYIDLRFIHKMLQSRNNLKQKFILEYSNLFESIIQIIGLFEEFNKDIFNYNDIKITSINKLKYNLITNLN